MYSVTPEAAQAWRGLLLAIARRAAEPLEVLDYPAPAPLSELWARPDLGAVFMCGLPFSRARPQPQLLAAPVPSPPEFEGRAQYWSEFVVRAESAHDSLRDTFGGRIAFTATLSQSGFAAPLHALRGCADTPPLYAELIAPQVNPQGALAAVADGLADVAPIDCYSLRLLQRFNPALVQRVRVVARTSPWPIPPLVASKPSPRLSSAFLTAHDDNGPAVVHMRELSLQRFVLPQVADYELLGSTFDSTLAYWRRQPLAHRIHPAFQGMLAA